MSAFDRFEVFRFWGHAARTDRSSWLSTRIGHDPLLDVGTLTGGLACKIFDVAQTSCSLQSADLRGPAPFSNCFLLESKSCVRRLSHPECLSHGDRSASRIISKRGRFAGHIILAQIMRTSHAPALFLGVRVLTVPSTPTLHASHHFSCVKNVP